MATVQVSSGIESIFFLVAGTETAKDDLKNQRFTSYMHLVFQQKKKSWHISPGRVSDMGFSFEKMT